MFRTQDADDNRLHDIEFRGLPFNLLGDAAVVSPLNSTISLTKSKIEGRAAAQAVIRKNSRHNDSVTAA